MPRALTLVLLMSACVGPDIGASAADTSALIVPPAEAIAEPVPRRPAERDPLAAPSIVPVPCRPTSAITFAPAGARRLADVESVGATVTLPRQCAVQHLTLELIGPRGHVFEVRHADPRGAASVAFRFPVAGAAIALRGLSGPWQARAFADGAALPSQSFELER